MEHEVHHSLAKEDPSHRVSLTLYSKLASNLKFAMAHSCTKVSTRTYYKDLQEVPMS